MALEKKAGASQRQITEEMGIPRSTLQHWLKRKDSIDADAEVVAFFESPAGVAFLHRLTIGAQFVMTLVGPCGIRLVCLFLELTGLDQFIAACYGAQQKVSVAMEEAVERYGQEEEKRLAEEMKPKQVTVCQDETFHPETCLVAIEPVSNFIVLEKYTSSRRAQEWSQAMGEAMEGLPIEVVQSTSDEARGILHHVKQELGAHHSPDLFHVQREVAKATSVALASRRRQAEKAMEEATREVRQQREEKEAYLKEKHGPGRPPAFEKRMRVAVEKEAAAKAAREKAAGHQERVKQATERISRDYHPYDLQTGAARRAEEVAASLEEHFSEIEQVVGEAGLPERCLKAIKKAKRVMVEMIATIAFFFLTARAKVEALSLSPEVERAVEQNLIPGLYLGLVAEKAKSAEQREGLKKKSQELLAPLKARDGPLGDLPEQERRLVEQVAQECAQLFQRSSSCVEGRNGQLALRHHSLHRVSDRKLAALTTVHNYFVKRPDGTTAAERFFGARPRDLFQWLLEQVDIPGRPAQKRPQPKCEGFLSQAAA